MPVTSDTPTNGNDGTSAGVLRISELEDRDLWLGPASVRPLGSDEPWTELRDDIIPPNMEVSLEVLDPGDLDYTVSLDALENFPQELVTALTIEADLVESFSPLGHLTALRSLEVSSYSLDDGEVSSLTDLTSLGHLSISSPLVSDESIRHLGALPQLESLDVGGTRISNQGFAWLRTALPQCRVLPVDGPDAVTWRFPDDGKVGDIYIKNPYGQWRWVAEARGDVPVQGEVRLQVGGEVESLAFLRDLAKAPKRLDIVGYELQEGDIAHIVHLAKEVERHGDRHLPFLFLKIDELFIADGCVSDAILDSLTSAFRSSKMQIYVSDEAEEEETETDGGW